MQSTDRRDRQSNRVNYRIIARLIALDRRLRPCLCEYSSSKSRSIHRFVSRRISRIVASIIFLFREREGERVSERSFRCFRQTFPCLSIEQFKRKNEMDTACLETFNLTDEFSCSWNRIANSPNCFTNAWTGNFQRCMTMWTHHTHLMHQLFTSTGCSLTRRPPYQRIQHRNNKIEGPHGTLLLASCCT